MAAREPTAKAPTGQATPGPSLAVAALFCVVPFTLVVILPTNRRRLDPALGLASFTLSVLASLAR